VDIEGYSGFRTRVEQRDGHIVFIKTSSKNRLEKQCKKQIWFRQQIEDASIGHIFKIPEVYKQNKKNRCYSFEMQYINGRNILSELEYSSYDRLDYIIECILYLIDWEISRCTPQKIDAELFKEKIGYIEKKTGQDISKITDRIVDLSNQVSGKYIPVGICHGDLTLSNMLFGNKIVLLDFLDSFVETPLQDIGKLLQEVDLKWSLQMSKASYDVFKIRLGYNYFKDRIYREIEKLYFDKEIVKLFHVMVQARLFPYVKDDVMFKKIYDSCEKIMEG